MKAKLPVFFITILVVLFAFRTEQDAHAMEESLPSDASPSASLSFEDSESSPSADLSDESLEDEVIEVNSAEDSEEQALPDQLEDPVSEISDEIEEILDLPDSEESEITSLENDQVIEAVTNSVRIEGQNETIFYDDINHQTLTFADTLGTTHFIDHPTALGAALTAAQQAGIAYEIVDYGAFGFYLQSFNDEAPSGNLGWLYKVNGFSPMVGAGDYEVAEGDTVLFFYGDWQNPNQPLLLESDTNNVYLGDEVVFQVSRFDEASGGYLSANDVTIEIVELDLELLAAEDGAVDFVFPSTGTFTAFAEAPGQIRSQQLSIIVSPIPISSNRNPTQDQINQAVQDGADYLIEQQDEEGSISSLGVSAWAAMALSAAGTDPNTVTHSPSLMEYLATNNDQLTLPTDWERQTLAVLASGMDPKDFGGEDCIQKILNFFQDGQLGDPDLLNDDIFGILALLGSGLDSNDPVISDPLSFLVSNQNEDGGFSFAVGGDSGTNTTAAALQALVYAVEVGDFDFSEPIESARNYLLDNQNDDGGFSYISDSESDAASTAWIVLAFNALDIDPLSLTTRFDLHPVSYMLDMQNSDGSFSWMPDFAGDPFTTSFVVQALSGTHWPIIGDFAIDEVDDSEDTDQDTDDDSDEEDTTDLEDTDEDEEESTSVSETVESSKELPSRSIGEILGEAVAPPIFAKDESKVVEEVVTDTFRRNQYFLLAVISGLGVVLFLRRVFRVATSS